jgi:hypothetical protein
LYTEITQRIISLTQALRGFFKRKKRNISTFA